MKYLLLIYHNQKSREAWAGYTQQRRAAGVRAHVDLVNDLAAAGRLVASEALAEPEAGRRVTVRDGRVNTTDGPYAEVKEYLAGFYLIDCDDSAQAVEYAARIPEAALGLVEVRPVHSDRTASVAAR
ncbi:YciI family protein [Catellatospora sp. KI3]|uniref:YciI family protein n=1 Tax=Catellatospora sp. KI3 TaxID=3041620 RepID=UPI002482A828|nr:YciI family protein [Catellatospora sp. KI3]MDI1461464.1 YciI family protein [Catellatospora sp. KI3]